MAYKGGYATGYRGITDVLIPGVSTFQPAAAGYGARISDYWVRLAPSEDAPLRYFTQDSLAPRSDDRSSTEENVLELGHVFARSDLTGGAGLDFFPRPLFQDRETEDNIRFWDSMNVDVSRARYDAEYRWRLHRKLQQWHTYSPSNATCMVRTSGYLYIAGGNLVYWYNDLGDTTAEGSHDFSNAIDDMCVIADDVYALSNNAILKKGAADSSFSAWHTPGAGETIERIWAAKNRVLAHRTTTTPTSEFLEFDTSGTAAIVDSFDPGVDVNAVVDGGPAIVAAVTSGELYSFTLDASQALELTSITPVPAGEEPISLTYNQGVLAYMTIDPSVASSTTVARFYAAEVFDARFDYTIGNAQLILEWDSPITAPRTNVSDLMPTRDEIWWVIYEPDVAGDKYVSLYRFDLVTRGFNRAHAIGVTAAADVTHLVVFQDRMVFINDNDVWVEAESTFADVGWLISPMINFGLNTTINWVASVLEVLDVESARLQIELLRSSQEAGLFDWGHASWVSEQRITSPYQAGVEVPMIGVRSPQMALQVRIYPSLSGSPGVRKLALRGLPSHRDLIVELPVNVSDLIELPHRAPAVSQRWGDKVHQRLFNFQGRHVEIEVLDPPMVMVGIVDQIAEPITYLTARGSQGQMCVVRVRGQRVTETEGVVSIGTAGLGVALLGIGTMGIGELTEIS